MDNGDLMEWIELDHTVVEWFVFIAIIATLIAVKIYVRKRRRMVAEQDAARRQAEYEAKAADHDE